MRKTVTHVLVGIILGVLLLGGFGSDATTVCTPLGTLTATLGLCKPAAGETGWSAAVNNNFDLIDANAAAAATSTPLDAMTGLGLTWVSGTSITVAIGAASSDDSNPSNRVLMINSAAITGTTAATWVVGNNQPKLDAGGVGNNQTWHVFEIKRTDTNVVDVLFSQSATSPTLPTNYTKQRRLGSVLTDGAAAIRNFVQDGDDFLLLASILDVNTANPGTSAVTATLTVPTGIKVTARINAAITSASNNVMSYVSSLDQNDEAPSQTVAPLSNTANANTSTNMGGVQLLVRTNTAKQIRYRLSVSAAGDIMRIATLGWIDRRGRG